MGKDREQRGRRPTARNRRALVGGIAPDRLSHITYHLWAAQQNQTVPSEGSVVRSEAVNNMLAQQVKILDRKARKGHL